tara:strand:- start:36 stop:194 length:159 start_codon:yes stop_codon:yes gene_type:complete
MEKGTYRMSHRYKRKQAKKHSSEVLASGEVTVSCKGIYTTINGNETKYWCKT